MGFKVTVGAERVGWIPASGDALRAIGNAVGAMMLSPVAPGFRVCAPPLFRVRVGARVSVLEKRIHATPTGRCSRGRWERSDSADTPRSAREWTKLAKFWAWYAAEISEGRRPYSWGEDRGKDQNRCRTRAHANAPDPTLGSGSCGRGRKGRNAPSRLDSLGYAPASGARVAQTTADRRAANRHRARLRRKARNATECSGYGPCTPGNRCWAHEGGR